jgi:hypothetical protein
MKYKDEQFMDNLTDCHACSPKKIIRFRCDIKRHYLCVHLMMIKQGQKRSSKLL